VFGVQCHSFPRGAFVLLLFAEHQHDQRLHDIRVWRVGGQAAGLLDFDQRFFGPAEQNQNIRPLCVINSPGRAQPQRLIDHRQRFRPGIRIVHQTGRQKKESLGILGIVLDSNSQVGFGLAVAALSNKQKCARKRVVHLRIPKKASTSS
jgi:hypothetical protein